MPLPTSDLISWTHITMVINEALKLSKISLGNIQEIRLWLVLINMLENSLERETVNFLQHNYFQKSENKAYEKGTLWKVKLR